MLSTALLLLLVQMSTMRPYSILGKLGASLPIREAEAREAILARPGRAEMGVQVGVR